MRTLLVVCLPPLLLAATSSAVSNTESKRVAVGPAKLHHHNEDSIHLRGRYLTTASNEDVVHGYAPAFPENFQQNAEEEEVITKLENEEKLVEASNAKDQDFDYQDVVNRALGLHQFVVQSAAPLLRRLEETDNVAERERFLQSPSAFLIEAGSQDLQEFSAEQLQRFDEYTAATFALSRFDVTSDSDNLATTVRGAGCIVCMTGFGIVISAVVVTVGLMLTHHGIDALANTVSTTASLSMPTTQDLLTAAHYENGIVIVAEMIFDLSKLICQKISACSVSGGEVPAVELEPKSEAERESE